MTNDLSERDELTWMARATSSLPVPLSPVMRMVERLGAAWAISSKTWVILGLRPMMPENLWWRRAASPFRVRVLVAQPPVLDRVLQHHQHLVVLEGLGDVVEGAQLHRLDGRVHRGVGGDHQDGQAIVLLLQLVQHLRARRCRAS